MARYAPTGSWRTAFHETVTNDEDDSTSSVTVDIADCRDQRGGRTYTDGTFRVTLKNVTGMRSKTFYGEMAWANAQRLASDAMNRLGRRTFVQL